MCVCLVCVSESTGRRSAAGAAPKVRTPHNDVGKNTGHDEVSIRNGPAWIVLKGSIDPLGVQRVYNVLGRIYCDIVGGIQGLPHAWN